MHTSRSSLLNLASCLSLAALAVSIPTNDQVYTLSKRNATVQQSVFFEINGTEVEKRIANLKSEGYRPTSLSIHGSPTDAKYAGIWTKQDGEAYETILGADETAYNAWLDQWRARGYVSTHVSATGPAFDALFAGVMQELPSVSSWNQRCGVEDPWAIDNTTAATPMTVKGVSMYGTPSERLYCILEHENTINFQQTVWYQTEFSMTDYRTLEASETSKRYWRPVYIDVSEDQLFTPIFDDTSVGQWATFTDLTTSQLDLEIAARKAKGMYPIHISGAGSVGARYAVIFAERTTPLEREWHATGTVTGFSDNAGTRAAMDSVMQKFMQRSSIRQAQLAASVNGTIVASRAFTWAESDRAIVEPEDKFLLASNSKMFTYAAINDMITKDLLNLTTPVYSLLGYDKPADERSMDITVQHLLDHTAGFDRSVSPDLGFVFTSVAQSLNQSTPATLRQVIEWVFARPLDYTPGTSGAYSNYGTMLLSYVIANITGETYMSYLEKNVLEGADVELWGTATDLHKSDRIVQETKYTAISALTPLSSDRVSSTYGGDGSVKEEAIGAFGLKASASTLAQFIGTHSVYGIGGRQRGGSRDGSLAGSRTFSQSEYDDIDWAVTLNTREYVDENAWQNLIFYDIYDIWRAFSLAR
ncbi:beta-lactamase/transpeptidase-like protein [Boeremia exigua]|uniref:beta-lactamase/transpeptidase-like protein n=1 Tax=Boeremia exigua TaxID=749465 RepID=UPI001E8CCAE7|nr:beta-lactamase/transpeptidase-like protein [Boeremia exigua]KAH6612580.1 beta-lactamase/transpeptidase-like protein [Boeremia exigua]